MADPEQDETPRRRRWPLAATIALAAVAACCCTVCGLVLRDLWQAVF